MNKLIYYAFFFTCETNCSGYSSMDGNEIKDARLFGLKISNTATLLLFYIILPLMLNLIPYYLYLSVNMIEYPLSSFPTDPLTIISLLAFIAIPTLLIPLFIYILIKCIINRKFFREQEVFRVRWFGFRLDNTSLIVLFLLSIFSLILDIRALIGSINSIMIYLRFSFSPPSSIFIQLYSSITVVLITINFHRTPNIRPHCMTGL